MKLLKRAKSNDGAVNTVSFMFIVSFIMFLMVSFVDLGIYFNVKNEMQAAAESGARNVALYGGTSTALRTAKAKTTAVAAVEASMTDKMKNGTSLTTKPTISCGPSKAAAPGDRVYCTVKYTYKGLIGKHGLFFAGQDQEVTVEGSAVSEMKGS